MNVYVASSWRNPLQPHVVRLLRGEGYEVYDFRNPKEGDKGFHWSEIDPAWKRWRPETYRNALSHPLAEAGYKTDYAAMCAADVFVLVQPCGRSAHLEFGWACGRGKGGVILLADGEPELMNKMADHICCTTNELLDALRALEAKA